MAAKKKASTKNPGPALATLAASMPSERETVRIRRISNGYVVTHESCDGKGRYQERETFVEKKPTLNMPTGKKR